MGRALGVVSVRLKKLRSSRKICMTAEEYKSLRFLSHNSGLKEAGRNTLAWTRTTRSGAPSLFVESVACAVAVRVFGGAGVEEGDAEAATRSRRDMERFTRGAGVVAKLFFWTCPFLLSPFRREKGLRNTLAWTRTTRRLTFKT